MKIKIVAGDVEAKGILSDTNTAHTIYGSLPIEGVVNTWGDEIYFKIAARIEQEDNAKEVVEEGDLAFWPQGNCFCIFFGRTPASTDEKPRAASAVNVFGTVDGDYSVFKNVKNGENIVIEKIEG